MSRIIAGRAGGRRLATPAHARTRPTSDRVRESAFNLIADWAGTAGEPVDSMLDRFSFLDLYAGTAAVALEAASRGAGPVVAVERDKATAQLARGNARATGLEVAVVAASVDAYLAGEPRPFDVVWFDPPYDVANDALSPQITRLMEGWLAGDGLVIVERSSRDEPFAWPDALGHRWHRRYGETTLYLATKEDA
ncbi:MAG: RsmD family RNA methyltransferase [Propionibacteriaceae bacterium]|nr:RsmD family RNA methyltransferase [Propionibacteriaceae bacterium]